jgi:N-acyl-D-aspartate/D-glutamate deacylase
MSETVETPLGFPVVFDYEALQDTATYDRPTLSPTGIDYVLVNRRVVIDHDRHTGERPGRVIYGPRRGAR